MSKHKNTEIVKSNSPANDFRAALDRLKRNEPLHPELRKQAARGKLRISMVAIAKEADRSRSLIAKDDCAYPDVRREILAFLAGDPVFEKPIGRRWSGHEIIKRLRQDNAALTEDRRVLATRVQEALNVIRALEGQHDRAERQTERRKARKAHPNQLVGLAKADGNVLSFSRSETGPGEG